GWEPLRPPFGGLEAEGVVALPHFPCCSTCGHAEIGAETAETEAKGVAVVGYVFYHVQNTEAAVQCGGLYLGFGATEDGTGPIREVGRRVVTVLERNGLNTRWNVSYTECVYAEMD